jgi:hypothetical protein
MDIKPIQIQKALLSVLKKNYRLRYCTAHISKNGFQWAFAVCGKLDEKRQWEPRIITWKRNSTKLYIYLRSNDRDPTSIQISSLLSVSGYVASDREIT